MMARLPAQQLASGQTRLPAAFTSDNVHSTRRGLRPLPAQVSESATFGTGAEAPAPLSVGSEAS